MPQGAGLFCKFSPKIRSLLAKCFPRPGHPEPLPVLEEDDPGRKCCAGTCQSQADFAIRDHHGDRGRCPASPLGLRAGGRQPLTLAPMGSDSQEASWQPRALDLGAFRGMSEVMVRQ